MSSVLKPEALTTLANLKEEVGIAVSDTSKDNQLEKLINRATRKIEERTERKLKARRYNGNTEVSEENVHATTNVADQDYIYFDGSTKEKGGDTLINGCSGEFYLPAWPVLPNTDLAFVLATLTERRHGITDGEDWNTTELKEWDDYIIDRPNGVLRLLNRPFEYGVRNYRITCAAGFLEGEDEPYVPDDLEDLDNSSRAWRSITSRVRSRSNIQTPPMRRSKARCYQWTGMPTRWKVAGCRIPTNFTLIAR